MKDEGTQQLFNGERSVLFLVAKGGFSFNCVHSAMTLRGIEFTSHPAVSLGRRTQSSNRCGGSLGLAVLIACPFVLVFPCKLQASIADELRKVKIDHISNQASTLVPGISLDGKS